MRKNITIHDGRLHVRYFEWIELLALSVVVRIIFDFGGEFTQTNTHTHEKYDAKYSATFTSDCIIIYYVFATRFHLFISMNECRSLPALFGEYFIIYLT